VLPAAPSSRTVFTACRELHIYRSTDNVSSEKKVPERRNPSSSPCFYPIFLSYTARCKAPFPFFPSPSLFLNLFCPFLLSFFVVDPLNTAVDGYKIPSAEIKFGAFWPKNLTSVGSNFTPFSENQLTTACGL